MSATWPAGGIWASDGWMHDVESGDRKTYDALIVGAGPAGSTAAFLLARAGRRVLLLDRCRFPRERLCGGLLTAKTVELLRSVFGLGVPELAAAGVLRYRRRRYRVWNRRRVIFEGRLAEAFHFTDRRIYDHFWLQAALRAGAEARMGRPVAGVDPHRGRVDCRGGGSYRGRVLIGADGALSRVRAALRRSAGPGAQPATEMALALEAVVSRRRVAGLPTRAELFFGDPPWGYGWSFPGRRRHRVGVCALRERTSPAVLRRAFDDLARRFPAMKTRPPTPRARYLPYGSGLRRPGAGAALLIGDACGLADPILGEGIYFAHRSARLAAAAILADPRDARGAVERYRRTLEKTILPELRMARRWRAVLHTLLPPGDFRLLGLLLHLNRRRVEAMIQGRRSYRPWRRRGGFSFPERQLLTFEPDPRAHPPQLAAGSAQFPAQEAPLLTRPFQARPRPDFLNSEF